MVNYEEECDKCQRDIQDGEMGVGEKGIYEKTRLLHFGGNNEKSQYKQMDVSL